MLKKQLKKQAEFADAVQYTAERAAAIADAIDQGNAEDAIEIAELAVAETQAAVDVRDALSEQVAIDSAIQEGLEDLDAAQQVADAAEQALEAAESALENAQEA